MTKKLIINVTTNGCATFLWNDPTDTSRYLSNDLNEWVKFAKLAERGKFHSIFIADHLSPLDVYKGSFKSSAEQGVCINRIDPSLVVSAIASVTKNISIGLTSSTISENPYHFARRLSTLDHLTKGRFAWNIVTSYLASTGKQLLSRGDEGLPPHDERYEQAGEFLDVVYELLLSSWRSNAVLYKDGVENDEFIDPNSLRKINHTGKYYNVEGPHISEPTIQRFPVICQAGSSETGKLFAAENAEIVYLTMYNVEQTIKDIKQIKSLARDKFGRDPNSIKIIVPINPIIGKTHEEAEEKYSRYKNYFKDEIAQVIFGSISNIDLDGYDWDDEVKPKKHSNGITSSTKAHLSNGKNNGVKKGKTKREIVDSYVNGGNYVLVGTGEELADEISSLVAKTDIDGFNIGFQSTFPVAFEDIVEYLLPELRKRGLFWDDYEYQGGTFRENLFGKKSLDETHPAYPLIWNNDETKSQFEQRLKAYKVKRDSSRK